LNVTPHVLDGLSVHRQEFKTTHGIRYMSYRLVDCLLAGMLASSQLTCTTYTWCLVYSLELPTMDRKIICSGHASKQPTNLYDIHLMPCVSSWTPDDGWKDHPKHVEW